MFFTCFTAVPPISSQWLLFHNLNFDFNFVSAASLIVSLWYYTNTDQLVLEFILRSLTFASILAIFFFYSFKKILMKMKKYVQHTEISAQYESAYKVPGYTFSLKNNNNTKMHLPNVYWLLKWVSTIWDLFWNSWHILNDWWILCHKKKRILLK